MWYIFLTDIPATPADPEKSTSTTLVKVSETRPISQADFLTQLMSAFSESAPHYSASTTKTDKVRNTSFGQSNEVHSRHN